MKKKGFTLVEILGVLVVLSMLVLIIAPTIINRLSASKETANDSQNKIIFESTNTLIDADKEKYKLIPGDVYCITLQNLLDENKLAEPLKDVTTNKPYDTNTTVKVVISNDSVRTFELVSPGTCSSKKNNDIVFQVTPGNSVWSKTKTVKIYYPNIDSGYTNKYSLDGNNWTLTANQPTTVVVNKDLTIFAKTEGKAQINKEKQIKKIDNLPPIITSISQGGWKEGSGQALSIILKDNESGVAGYYIGTTNTKPDANASGWITFNLGGYGATGTATVYRGIGMYYVYAKDKVGNVSEVKIVEVKDPYPPTCTINLDGTLGSNSWYRSNVVATLSTADEGGSGVASYGISTTNSPIYNNSTTLTQTADTKAVTYYGFVKDGAGNIGTCSKTFKKDATAPSKTNVNTGWYTKDTWTSADVPRTFESTDATSGIASYQWSSNCSGTANGTEASNYVPVTWSGTDVACHRAVDNAGNIGPWSDKTIIKIERLSVSCWKNTCHPCVVDDNWIDYSWGWSWSGASSGMDWWGTKLQYNTGYVTFTYRKDRAPEPYQAGYIEWGGESMTFGRSYANQQIDGTICTAAGTCKVCTQS